MNKSDRVRAAFTIEHRGDFIVLVDQAVLRKTMSVTNDAENVVRYLHDEGVLRHERVIYCDTDGIWDELKHDGRGHFTGFAPIRARTLGDAVRKAMTMRPAEHSASPDAARAEPAGSPTVEVPPAHQQQEKAHEDQHDHD